ncbi:SGNH/GDSL hydrolase family protein [Chitinophaga sp. MM2321]|uniref:SGNH/GDSL hydrolase family protein n=1 Tax=Chitinophaga sp. MM2321 TaxID=3137178 RepID=UPI0032D57820
MMTPLRYLALGDSYTIGESVAGAESFPFQTVDLLRSKGYRMMPPDIVATTGWTTGELEQGIKAAQLTGTYDVVTLLIGVNDQYRGSPVNEYRLAFTVLLQKAVAFAGNNPSRVVVLSIPDWGVSPFAGNRDRKAIAAEIDDYNAANKAVAQSMQVPWLDITPYTREAARDPSLLAPDGLHPAGKAYARWAKDLALMLQQALQQEKK